MSEHPADLLKAMLERTANALQRATVHVDQLEAEAAAVKAALKDAVDELKPREKGQ